jgi:hypothetical protein
MIVNLSKLTISFLDKSWNEDDLRAMNLDVKVLITSLS